MLCRHKEVSPLFYNIRFCIHLYLLYSVMQGILLYALRRTLITIWIIKTMTLIQLPTTINVTLLPILYLHFLGRKYHILSESFGKRYMPVSRHSVWCLFIIIYRVGDPSSAGRLTIYWSQILGPWSLGLPSLLPTQVSPQCRMSRLWQRCIKEMVFITQLSGGS